ncbi:hypothetical protein RND81_13G095200 [Saponaria officinalis]|uniref:MYND-type domain-containing protein n=1 Tax=Saponaria officinalis TaxID=3572 RepID=A0AAW1GVM0_SAPOF
MISRKKAKYNEHNSDPFEKLPDDLVISILSNLSFSSSSPSDYINVIIVCKRFNRLGLNQVVLSKACSRVFGLKVKKWCESAHRFLKLCVNAGSVEACYFLGMIRFYCLESRRSGASLMAKAAIKGHAPALYSLAVIQFNGSGGAKSNKDLRSGIALCARAACFGHVDAYRELGHCLQDGYGVKQDIPAGRRLLIQANARELTPFIPFSSDDTKTTSFKFSEKISSLIGSGCSALLSDFGCTVPAPEPHPANRFLVDWYGLHGLGPGLRLCSHAWCGRPETRAHEFRRCSVCGTVNYCSRGCQAMDWKMRHKGECSRIGPGQWVDVGPEFGMVGGAPLDQHHQVVS